MAGDTDSVSLSRPKVWDKHYFYLEIYGRETRNACRIFSLKAGDLKYEAGG